MPSEEVPGLVEPGPMLGDTEPTDERVSTARALLELHRRVFVPEPSCNWCLKRWPCDDASWSLKVVTRRAQLERGIQS